MYVGGKGTGFGVHWEDCSLGSASVMPFGDCASKFWFGIPSRQSERFRAELSRFDDFFSLSCVAILTWVAIV